MHKLVWENLPKPATKRAEKSGYAKSTASIQASVSSAESSVTFFFFIWNAGMSLDIGIF